MGRHKVTLATLPGVEYDESDRTLYVDVPTYLAERGPLLGTGGTDGVFLSVFRKWAKDMPAYPVRVYHVRGGE